MKRMSELLWEKEARGLFGDKKSHWLFECPECGEIQCIASVCKGHPELKPEEVVRLVNRKCFACGYSLETNPLMKHSVEVIMNEGTVPVFDFFESE